VSKAQCPGCDLVGPCRDVRSHVLTCASYGRLFKSDPAKCVDPEKYYIEQSKQARDPEFRRERREERYVERKAKHDAEMEFDLERWKTPADPLA